MTRVGIVAVASLALWGSALTAQQDQPARVYAAYHQIRYSDLPAYIGIHHEHAVPILDAMVEEGFITGHGAWIHNTGGEYNVRHAYRGNAGTNWDAFWGEFLDRMARRAPAEFERVNRMILAHEDEVWNIDQANTGGGQARYFYDTQFQVNFADMERFAQTFDDVLGPALSQAQADGKLVGWVTESHNTGGRFNWKVILLIDEWDDIDDLQAAFFGAAPLDHPLWGMFTAHRDELWEQMPGPDGN